MAIPTPEFKRKLNKAIKIVVREMRDGCVECLSRPKGQMCFPHYKRMLNMIVHPNDFPEVQELLRGSSK